MKHIRTISKVQVSPAQLSTIDIVSLVIAILSAVATILTTVVPLVEEKG